MKKIDWMWIVIVLLVVFAVGAWWATHPLKAEAVVFQCRHAQAECQINHS